MGDDVKLSEAVIERRTEAFLAEIAKKYV